VPYQKVVQQAQEAEVAVAETHAAFAYEFTAKRREHKASAKAKGKAKAKPAKPPPLPSTVPQAEAEKWIPANSSICRSVTRLAWCAHVPPNRRILTPWKFYGSDNVALIDVLVEMLTQHFEQSGDPVDSCSFDFASAVARCHSFGAGADAAIK
jgi:hypothetical protein